MRPKHLRLLVDENQAFKEMLDRARLHKTYGVYLDRSWKRNAVAPEDLEAHIQYNLEARPGRALVVDGKVVHCGYFKPQNIEVWVRDMLPEIDRNWTPTQPTRPYQ